MSRLKVRLALDEAHYVPVPPIATAKVPSSPSCDTPDSPESASYENNFPECARTTGIAATIIKQEPLELDYEASSFASKDQLLSSLDMSSVSGNRPYRRNSTISGSLGRQQATFHVKKETNPVSRTKTPLSVMDTATTTSMTATLPSLHTSTIPPTTMGATITMMGATDLTGTTDVLDDSLTSVKHLNSLPSDNLDELINSTNVTDFYSIDLLEIQPPDMVLDGLDSFGNVTSGGSHFESFHISDMLDMGSCWGGF